MFVNSAAPSIFGILPAIESLDDSLFRLLDTSVASSIFQYLASNREPPMRDLDLRLFRVLAKAPVSRPAASTTRIPTSSAVPSFLPRQVVDAC